MKQVNRLCTGLLRLCMVVREYLTAYLPFGTEATSRRLVEECNNSKIVFLIAKKTVLYTGLLVGRRSRLTYKYIAIAFCI